MAVVAGQHGAQTAPILPRNTARDTMAEEDDYHEGLSGGEEDTMENLSDVDAQSLMEPAISRAATRLISRNISAVEKAAIMDDLEGGVYSETEGDTTPPTVPTTPTLLTSPERAGKLPEHLRKAEERKLDQLPVQTPRDIDLPSPWVAGPKPIVIQRQSPTEGRSALKEALTAVRPRASSWNSDAFKRFLPSMPSMPKSSSFITTASFFSSSSEQKSKSRIIPISRDNSSSFHSLASSNKSPEKTQSSRYFPIAKASHSNGSSATLLADQSTAPAIRRVASEESLLYHSLSRASSLGDDTRFEHIHDMVNSRGKAIRDSLQDRSSFKMPALPSIPSMPRVPHFTIAMNCAFSQNIDSPKHKSGYDADCRSVKGILPGTAKKASTSTYTSTAAPGLVAASVSRPEVTKEVLHDIDGINTTFLDHALDGLTGDVVIMGGYRGSILRSAKPPHQQLWAPLKMGLNLRKVNLEVGLEPEDEERMEDSIFPSGMLQHVGPIDISRRLFKKLRGCENAKNGSLRVWDYGYDWRLSPHLLSKKLEKFLEALPSNQSNTPPTEKGALVVAHSLGGLITRHAINQRPELFSGVVYAGVPQSCVNILGPIRNGDAVLLSSRVLTAQVNFTIRTTFALLPLDGYCFIDKNRKDDYRVDFFDADDWIKYRFSPCTDPPLPPKAQPTGSLANMLRNGSLTNLQLPRRISINTGKKSPLGSMNSSSTVISTTDRQPSPPSLPTRAGGATRDVENTDRSLAPQMGNLSNPVNRGQSTNSSVSTTVTIPRDKAITYLRRTLADTKKFKLELEYNAEYGVANRYPPAAVIYGKSTPTVYAARVDGRDGIACADSYDDLAFASGDGVCLAKEAMVPKGYSVAKGGHISSDRGHVTLLGDLNAVGKAILAIRRGRAKGIGLGVMAEGIQTQV